MKVNGRILAKKILRRLKLKTRRLKKRGIVPTLTVVLVGETQDSLTYVNLKKKRAKEIGASIILKKESLKISQESLLKIVEIFNQNPKIQGIIIQRPLPLNLDTNLIQSEIAPEKDVDGFLENSRFEPPIGLAVLGILKYIYGIKKLKKISFPKWLKTKKILIIGRGKTGGKPIIKTLKKIFVDLEVAHSKTSNVKSLMKNADIVISCVGKRRVVKANMIKKGAILIGVGLTFKDQRFYGDYEEAEIKDRASFYTPTPGGVGPLNVAYLMSNLIKACKKQFIIKN